MAVYTEEEEVWKCPKHPSRRRKSGICPSCLRERLVTLCPDCANSRPCSCSCAVETTPSSSSSSSSFSLFSSSSRGGSYRETGNSKSLAAVGEVGRVSNLIDSEPSFRRSRSVAVPLHPSRSRFLAGGESGDCHDRYKKPLPPVSRSKISFWSVFKLSKNESKMRDSDPTADDDYSKMMRRSRSVAAGTGDCRASGKSAKGRGWYFPSPMKAFRQSKMSKVVQERSPLRRG